MPMTVTWPKIEICKIQDGGGSFVCGSRTACRQGLHDKNCKFLKSKLADGRHFENSKIATSQWKIVRFWWNLVHCISYWTRLQSRDQKWNSRWRLPPSGKSLFWPLLINRLSDFSEILYEKAERHADKGYGTKMQMCKIQDGGRPPFWKSLNRHISVKNCPILMMFCTLHQILNPVTSPKIEIYGVQDGLKFAFLAIAHRPIVRFRRNFVCASITACRQRPHDKNCKFSKSKKADGRHFENR